MTTYGSYKKELAIIEWGMYLDIQQYILQYAIKDSLSTIAKNIEQREVYMRLNGYAMKQNPTPLDIGFAYPRWCNK